MRLLAALLVCCCAPAPALGAANAFEFKQDDAKGELRVIAGGREAFVFNYSHAWDLPHFYPLNTPSGKNLLVQKTEPYPHHRAFWFADTVEREGTTASLYNAYYSGVKKGLRMHEPPFDTGIRHVSFQKLEASSGSAMIEEMLVWETKRSAGGFPLLDENRVIKLHAVEGGGYFMDMSFTLTASYGDVKFISDAVHYAWPYLRMNPDFSGEKGGVITADNGTTGQAATNMKAARWIDYSNTVDGATEGVAVFQFPDGEEHHWLTREYGAFGPRRPDAQSGKPFTVKKGDAIRQRVGVLVHKGDVTGGRVAEFYDNYVSGKL